MFIQILKQMTFDKIIYLEGYYHSLKKTLLHLPIHFMASYLALFSRREAQLIDGFGLLTSDVIITD